MTDASPTLLDRRLVLAQAFSGAVFALFLLAHLANQMLAALGPTTYDGTQQLLRRAYQAPPIELAVVIVPLLAHATIGVLRIARRRAGGGRAPANLRAKLHRWSGIVLLVFFLGHVTATRGASLVFHVFPAFEGIAFTLRWVPAYFWPYYTAFALAGLYHAIHGLGVALPMLGVRLTLLRKPAVSWTIVTIGGVALIAGLLRFGGAFGDVTRPDHGAYAQLLFRLGIAHDPANDSREHEEASRSVLPIR